MNIEIDTHTHTLASGHAYNTLREMAAMAAEKGLKGLAITEHSPKMPGTCHIFTFRTLEWFQEPCTVLNCCWARS